MPYAVLPFTETLWNTGIPSSTVWNITSFIIYNSLPSSFLFQRSKDELAGDKLNTSVGIISALSSLQIKGSGAIQILKALQT